MNCGEASPCSNCQLNHANASSMNAYNFQLLEVFLQVHIHVGRAYKWSKLNKQTYSRCDDFEQNCDRMRCRITKWPIVIEVVEFLDHLGAYRVEV